MSACDSDALQYRLGDSLNVWSTKWVLDANMLFCAGCSRGQRARDANQPFRHGDGCRLSSEVTLYPWRELAEMLCTVLQAPA
jgi:hypothetical protein